MKISVLIPTFNRVESLQRCFQALSVMSRMPDEVVLVARAEDKATQECAREWAVRIPIRVTIVDQPGTVRALNAGLVAMNGDVVAITDDDTAPRSDWLLKMEAWYESNAEVGGLGGRDWIHQGDLVVDGVAKTVGKIQPFGRLVGNHHLGDGAPREVDFLKGANMSFRKSAIEGLKFEERLRGRGAQVYLELPFSLTVLGRGWKLIYDPAVAVDHFPAARVAGSLRGELSAQAVEDGAFNLYLSLCTTTPGTYRRFMACLWQVMVGTSGAPGIAHLLLGLLRGRNVFPLWKAATRGRRSASETVAGC